MMRSAGSNDLASVVGYFWMTFVLRSSMMSLGVMEMVVGVFPGRRIHILCSMVWGWRLTIFGSERDARERAVKLYSFNHRSDIGKRAQ